MKVYKSQNMVTFEDEDGVRFFPNSMQDLLELSTNDYVEVFVSNTATTAVIATELNLIIEQIS